MLRFKTNKDVAVEVMYVCVSSLLVCITGVHSATYSHLPPDSWVDGSELCRLLSHCELVGFEVT